MEEALSGDDRTHCPTLPFLSSQNDKLGCGKKGTKFLIGTYCVFRLSKLKNQDDGSETGTIVLDRFDEAAKSVIRQAEVAMPSE